jgi:hypothetical protein
LRHDGTGNVQRNARWSEKNIWQAIMAVADKKKTMRGCGVASGGLA